MLLIFVQQLVVVQPYEIPLQHRNGHLSDARNENAGFSFDIFVKIFVA